MIELTDWGRLPGGETVRLATLRDGHGLECRIASYGATLTAIRTPDRDERIDDVLLGFDTLDGYLSPAFHAARAILGCTVGRYANRIAGARFAIDGVDYALASGDGVRLALTSPAGGRRMQVITSEPGIQLYSANSFDGSLCDGDGRPFVRRQALCLETQHLPDSPNRPDFPTTLLRPGEVYRSETRLRFDTV